MYYRGTARLRDGRATVRLPDYFEALTRPGDRTVQLTARGPEPFALSHGGVADGAPVITARAPFDSISTLTCPGVCPGVGMRRTSGVTV